jgi:hypothetical protein
MKELEQYEKVNQEVVIPVKSEMKLLGKIRPNKGHKVFKINTTTNEISEAEYFYDAVSMFSSSYERKKKLSMEEGFAYISALNKQNAIKKYKKLKK